MLRIHIDVIRDGHLAYESRVEVLLELICPPYRVSRAGVYEVGDGLTEATHVCCIVHVGQERPVGPFTERLRDGAAPWNGGPKRQVHVRGAAGRLQVELDEHRGERLIVWRTAATALLDPCHHGQALPGNGDEVGGH